MKILKYNIPILTLLFFANTINSQITTSPYSVYGLGDISSNLTGKNHAMSGSGIARKSDNYLNNLNPASYRGIDSLEFIMETGLAFQSTKYESQGSSYNAKLEF